MSRSSSSKPIFVSIIVLCMLVVLTLPAYATNFNSDAVPATPLLTVNGNPNTQILLPEGASKMEVYAAGELQKHFKLVSGADVPVLRGDPVNPTLSAGLNTTTIAATGIGYYPFTVTVTNPTNSAIDVTLTPPTVSTDLPVLELGATQIRIEAQSFVEISGLVTITTLTMSGTHSLSIHASSGNSWSEELILHVDCKGLNLLQNSDIEAASFNPWYEHSAFYPDATVSHGGNKSIKFSGANNAISGYESGLQLKSSYAYELSFWAKRDTSTDVGVKMRISELTSQYSVLQKSVEKDFQVSGDWALHRLVFYNNPRNNPEYGMSWFDLSLVGAGTIWLDDFELKEIGRVEVSDAPDYGPNIFKNGSFESDSAWVYEPGSSRIEYADAVDGSHVLFVDLGNKEWDGNHPYQNTLPIEKNHVYQLGFDAKRAGENPDGQIKLTLFPFSQGAALENVVMQVTPASEWMHYEMKFISHNDADFTSAYFPDLLVPGTKGELYIDNVTLFDRGEATEPVDSTITSAPSKKAVQIFYPELGVKPELGTSRHELTAFSWKILIATPESYPALAAKFADDLAFLGSSDGFAVNQEEQVIYIFGANASGTLNGVYDFIEANLGVLWTRSIDLGTLYDPMPTIPLIKVNVRDKSPFDIRGWIITGIGANGLPHADPATEIMLSHNKLNAKLAGYGSGDWEWQKTIGLEPVKLLHNLHSWLLASPTYQSLSRVQQAKFWNTDNEGNPLIDKIDSQLNFWNPDLPSLIAESLNAYLDEHDLRYIGVGMEDTWYATQKPEDTRPFEYAAGKFVQPGDPKYLSTVFFTFLNKVANLVKEKHADAIVTTYAYFFTETPPLGEIEDNIAVLIAPINEDMKLPITSTDSLENSAIRANMLAWKEKTDNILVYNYYGCFPYASNGFERPIGPRMQADFRFYAENGFTGLLPEGVVDNPNDNSMWGISALSMWLYSKLAWNPDADIQELIELFSHKAYGNAAEPMIEYYRLLQQTWDDNYTPIKWSTSLAAYVKAFYSDANHNARMKAALDQAWTAANDIQKQRIAPIKTAFEKNVSDAGAIEETALAKKSNAGRSAIMADLDMNGPIWGKAPVLSHFLNSGDMKPVPGTNTKVRMLWDESNLYIAYENFDEHIRDLKKSPVSGGWWQGESDDVETYISGVNPQGDPSARYRVYFSNPLGDQLVYREGVSHVADPGTWYTSAQIMDEEGTDNDRWVVVQAIPFEQLDISSPAKADTKLYGYFYRGHYNTANEFINIGWGGASVWQPLFFKLITLVDDKVVPPVITPSGDNPSTVNSPKENEVNVFINGRALNLGTVLKSNLNNRQVWKIAVNSDAVAAELAEEESGAIVSIPATADSDVMIASLNAELIQKMAQRGAVVELVTDNGSYKLSAQQIALDDIVKQLGGQAQLNQLEIQLEISIPSAEQQQWMDDAANKGSFTFVASPLNFVVRGVFGEQSIEITNFNAYVERTIMIPANMDPAQVATAVVIDADGTVRHVPTKVVARDGRHVAVISSMTNSLYALILNQVEFKDVANHWAKEAINSMGSKLIVNGVDGGTYQPDRDITRAEFVSILMRALGLTTKDGNHPFTDVSPADWYSNAVQTAYAYHLINGYEDDTFRPLNKITREEAMTIIAEAMELANLIDGVSEQSLEHQLEAYEDADQISNWAKAGVSRNLQAGIITGRSVTELAPKANITRAEVALIGQRLLRNSKLIS